MPDLIRALQGDLKKSDEKITEAADGLLQNIDLKDLLENLDNPEAIRELSFAFIEAFIRDIEDGIGRGQRFANTVLKNGAKNGG